MTVLPGRPLPLGVELTADGAHVSLISATAEAVTLCLGPYDPGSHGP